MRGVFRALVVTALLAATTVVAYAGPAWAAPLVQPGARHTTPQVPCTLGFVYDGTASRAGMVYIGTAAHCVTGVGQDIALLETGEVFGDVAVIGDLASSATDWALIEVSPKFHGRVSPAMKDSPKYPTGVTSPNQTSPDDPVKVPGGRDARMGADDAEVYRVSGMVLPADSGGPLAHVTTGRALGGASRGIDCPGIPVFCREYEGPTVLGIVAKARTAGFPIVLRTV